MLNLVQGVVMVETNGTAWFEKSTCPEAQRNGEKS